MNILIVVSHPNHDSMTWAIVNAFKDGAKSVSTNIDFDIIDLHQENYNPRFELEDWNAYRGKGGLDERVIDHQHRVDNADGIVIATPIYWWSLPAMMKGWLDRTLTNGWAYGSLGSDLVPLLKDRPTKILALAATDQEAFARHGYQNAFLTQVQSGTFAYCGIKSAETEVFFGVLNEEWGGIDADATLKRARCLGSEFARNVLEHCRQDGMQE